MKKVEAYKGMVIAEPNKRERLDDPNLSSYYIYTKDEWNYGNGLRYSEHDAGSIEEAREFIDDWRND